MSNRAEKAERNYFGNLYKSQKRPERDAFIKGYEQARKDTIETACDLLMNYVFEEVTPEMRDHFRKRLEEE